LAQVASDLGIGEFMRLGKGEEQTGGRTKLNLLADTFEAILGAIYVSKGLGEARGLVERFVFPLLEDTDALRENSDPKTTLQERIQDQGKPAPVYLTTFEGPDHDRDFHSKVLVAETVIGSGDGKSRKGAETEAAINALANLHSK
jgi:ribonuclease-3